MLLTIEKGGRQMGIANHDVEILSSFSNGKEVKNEEEERVLEEYRKIGWVKMGMKAGKSGDVVKITPTAALTPLGKQFVGREKILRSPWKRYFYKLINLPA
jgi:hypothetical protein